MQKFWWAYAHQRKLIFVLSSENSVILVMVIQSVKGLSFDHPTVTVYADVINYLRELLRDAN